MRSGLLPVTFFADFTCPFCYVTEAALHRLAPLRDIELRPRAFELYPLPEALPRPAHTPAELEAVAPLAAELELPLSPPVVRPRTRKAHEAALFAAMRGVRDQMRRAIYQAYWEEGADIGRIDVLMRLAERLEIDPTELKISLDIDEHGQAVTEQEALARRLRVAQVPTLFVGEGVGARILQGAREMAALDEALAAG